MTIPNFLIIGSQKAGTTAIYRSLKQHPEIFMSEKKEPGFFAFEGERLEFRSPTGKPVHMNIYGVTDLEAYRQLFSKVTDQKAIGEASVVYLISEKAPQRIRHYIPDAKLIAILRHPVELAHACFIMHRRDGLEPLSDFAAALEDQERRIRNNYFGGIYLQEGFYHRHLRRYFDLFNEDQIRIYLYDDFKADALAVLSDMFRFLGVDDGYVPDMSIRENVSGLPRNRLLYGLLTERRNPIVPYLKPYLPQAVRRFLIGLKHRNLEKPTLAPELSKQLIEVFREDIGKLQTLIDRDLSKWLE